MRIQWPGRLAVASASILWASLLAGYGCNGLARDHKRVLRISGNIEMTEVEVAFRISGRLAERLVDEGDRVRKGQVVARLDSSELERQKEQAEAALQAAQSQLEQLRTAIEFQRATVAAQVDQAQARLGQAQARLEELERGSRQQEIERARAQVREAESEHRRAQADWQRARELLGTEDISRAEFDQYEARYRAAEARLEQARQWLALVEEGPREEQIRAARAQVDEAKAALRLAEAQRLELRRKEQEVELRKAEIRRAKAQLAWIEEQLKETVVVAPVSGIVLSKAAEPGEVLAAGTAVVTIADVDHPWLRGYINEPDLGRVKIGQLVRVTTDSYPGKIYQGRVSFISSEAEFTPKQIQTEEERVKLVYRVKIDVENPNQELKLNMPVEAEIVLSQ